MDEVTGAEFRIEGARVHDIASFYAELNRVFMANEDWEIGSNLDALNDLLRGGLGALVAGPPTRIVWTDHVRSREALGPAETIAYYQQKLDEPQEHASEAAREALTELRAGRGRTYFDLVLEVFSDHPEIDLVLA